MEKLANVTKLMTELEKAPLRRKMLAGPRWMKGMKEKRKERHRCKMYHGQMKISLNIKSEEGKTAYHDTQFFFPLSKEVNNGDDAKKRWSV